jgi:hypothetical protein
MLKLLLIAFLSFSLWLPIGATCAAGGDTKKPCKFKQSDHEYIDGSVVCWYAHSLKCENGIWNDADLKCGNEITFNKATKESRVTYVAPCLSAFLVPDAGHFGIRNTCAQCKVAVVNWLPSVGIRQYVVAGYIQMSEEIPDQTGNIIGENPCEK